MTKEEAINQLIDAKDGCKEYLTDDALYMAIEALEPESKWIPIDWEPFGKTNDTIDRQTAIDYLITKANGIGAYGYLSAKEIHDYLKELPPEKPKIHAKTIKDILKLFEPYLTTDDLLECLEELKAEDSRNKENIKQ